MDANYSNDCINELRRVDIPPEKVYMGFGFYGRSFQLSDASCSTPGCRFRGGAEPGPCSDTSGILMYYEIMALLEQNPDLKPVYDKEAGVKYLVYNKDQWVSYDDEETFKQKVDWANKLGLGGSLIWASDAGKSTEHIAYAIAYTLQTTISTVLIPAWLERPSNIRMCRKKTRDFHLFPRPSLRTSSAKTGKAVGKPTNALRTAVIMITTIFPPTLAKVARSNQDGRKNAVEKANLVPSVARDKQTRVAVAGEEVQVVPSIAMGSVIQARSWSCNHHGVAFPERKTQTQNNVAGVLRHTAVTHPIGQKSPTSAAGPKGKCSVHPTHAFNTLTNENRGFHGRKGEKRPGCSSDETEVATLGSSEAPSKYCCKKPAPFVDCKWKGSRKHS